MTSVSPSALMVMVSVGTDHHPFDRLVSWVDDWAADNTAVRVVLQLGNSSPSENPGVDSRKLIPHPELLELFSMADAVVGHGGPSTIMDARMNGRLPIVVPRDPSKGEHVDGHQLRFADHLIRHGLASVVKTQDKFVAALDRAMIAPEEFVVPIDNESISGIVEFGRVVDDLMGVSTPLVPTSPAGAVQASNETSTTTPS